MPLYFWRDKSEREIDFLIDRGELFPVEVKATQTISDSLLANLRYWLSLKDNQQEQGCLVYAGDQVQRHKTILTLPWYLLS